MVLRHASSGQLQNLDLAIEALKLARRHVLAADCPELRKKIHSAIKSAGGARRHMERRIRATRAELQVPDAVPVDPFKPEPGTCPRDGEPCEGADTGKECCGEKETY